MKSIRKASIRDWIEILGSGASILGLAFATVIPIWAKWAVIVTSALCIFFLAREALQDRDIKRQVCNTEEEIEKARQKIIRTQGKVAIISRDLSWVTPALKENLLHKAKSVMVFAESEIELTKELEERGAVVYYYGHLGYLPGLRFMVLRQGRNDSQVVLIEEQNGPNKQNEREVCIYYTSNDGDLRDRWISALAADLVALHEKIGNIKDTGAS